jgi:hypothetical protein
LSFIDLPNSFAIDWIDPETGDKKHLNLRADNEEDMTSWIETIGNEVMNKEVLVQHDWWTDMFGNVIL